MLAARRGIQQAIRSAAVVHQRSALGAIRNHGGPDVPEDAPAITVKFLQPDGTTIKEVQARVGETLLQTAHQNDIDLGKYLLMILYNAWPVFIQTVVLTGSFLSCCSALLFIAQLAFISEGACEGVCACSTCHLILPQEMYDSLPDPSEDEEDMLDMAYGLTDTSRLGCQVEVKEEMDGVTLEMPKATR